MSSQMIPTANPILNLQSFKKPQIPSVSFSSQVSQSRISIGTGPCRARYTARSDALYAPKEARETLYELLGISEIGSSFSDIKKAYKQMARKYHPDVSPPERVEEYTQRFIKVQQAYETLSDPQARASYDRDLGGGFGFSICPRKSRRETEERGKWRERWQSQLDGLKRRESRDKISWASRMRNQR